MTMLIKYKHYSEQLQINGVCIKYKGYMGSGIYMHGGKRVYEISWH